MFSCYFLIPDWSVWSVWSQCSCYFNHIPDWSAWSVWSQCSRSCGGSGIRTRSRQCMNGSNCPGSNRSTQTCNTGTCGGSYSRNENIKADTCSEFFFKKSCAIPWFWFSFSLVQVELLEPLYLFLWGRHATKVEDLCGWN